MPLANPSVTSPRAGDRSRRQNRNPRDLTGKAYQRLHAEQDAKRAAASIDINDVRRAAWQEGYDYGHGCGIESFTKALREMYKAEGIQAVQEFLDELDADEAGDAVA
jgi:hypothetical protein